MLAFFKRELKSYFTTLTATVFFSAFLLIMGIYTAAVNLFGSYSTFEFTLSSNLVMLILIIPILTMRLFTEERQKGITPLLASLPVSATKQVLAKYLACALIYTMPMLLLCLYPLILSLFGQVHYTSAYIAILGYWLLGLALIAIGMFISSLTSTPIVAAVISFGAFLLFYLSDGLASMFPAESIASYIAFLALAALAAGLLWYLTQSSFVAGLFALCTITTISVVYLLIPNFFEGAFSALVAWFSVFARYYSYINTILDLADIFYYLSLCFIGIFLTVLSVEKKRWS